MKKILSIMLICIVLTADISVFAIEPNKLMSEAYYYSATLYYCDAGRSTVVLKNVKPMGTANDINKAAAVSAEYTELPLSAAGRLQNGQPVPAEDLNLYADSDVSVIITRNASGEMRVVAVKFL